MMVLWKARGGWIPLKGFSVLIIPPAWCRDGSPPANLKGWIPLRGFSVLVIPPVWYPDGSPPQPKGLNPLEGFSVLIIFPVMFVYDGVPEVTPHYQWGNGKPTRPRRRKVLFVLEVSQCLVLGVSRCWKWVDFWCWKWMVNLWTGLGPRSTT